MTLNVNLLGQFGLEVDGHTIDLPSRPAQSLVAYLSLHAQLSHRREKLAGLLWPEATDENARSYLRQALWRIRKAFTEAGTEWGAYLDVDDLCVALAPEGNLWLDAAVVLEADPVPTIASLQTAVSLYRGELLPGCYDDWIIAERERVRTAYHQKLRQLLGLLSDRGRWDEVVSLAERWIQEDDSPEPAYRALLRAHAALGNRTLVSATYQRCLTDMDRELGVPPSVETRRLYERLLQDDLDVSSEPVQKPSVKPPFLSGSVAAAAEPPRVIARPAELALLEQRLTEAKGGQGRVAFVVGESGTGKTTLLETFGRHALKTDESLLVAMGNCNAYTGLGDPYLPLRDILSLLTGEVEAGWVAGAISSEHARRLWSALPAAVRAILDSGPDLVETLLSGTALLARARESGLVDSTSLARLEALVERRTKQIGSGGLEQRHLFAQVTQVLRAIATHAPLVVIVDDLQWADLGSISLLFHLGRHLAGARLLLVGAYRPEEVALGRNGQRHPLTPLVNELRRDYGDIIVDMDKAQGRAFVDAVIDGEPNQLTEEFREMMVKQTGGNPLFTVELLRGLEERGDLVRGIDGCWVAGPALDWETLPARVEAVIAERVGRLEPALRDALRIASVEGERFTAEVVAAVHPQSERDILHYLSRDLDKRHRLIAAQSIQRSGHQLLSSYRFRHNLFQRYMYDTLDDVERVHLHEEVGLALESLHREPEAHIAIAPQLARHFQEAMIADKAIDYLHLAGDRANQVSAYEEAYAHLEHALTLLLAQPSGQERNLRELELQLSLGLAAKGCLGNVSRKVEEIFLRARELCATLDRSETMALVTGELAIVEYVRANYELAHQLSVESLVWADQRDNVFLAALGHWHIGIVEFAQGEFTSAMDHLQQVLSVYEYKKDDNPIIELRGSDAGLSAMTYLATCQWVLGFPEQALALATEAIHLARDLGHPFTLADILTFGGCLLSLMRRDTAALIGYADELTEISSRQILHWHAIGITYRGTGLVLNKQWQAGVAEIEAGIAANRAQGLYCYVTTYLGSLAEAYAALGRPDAARATLEEAVTFAGTTGETCWLPELLRERAALHEGLTAADAAEDDLRAAIQIAQEQQALSWELRAATDLARLLMSEGREAEGFQVLAPVYQRFTEGHDTADLVAARELLEALSEKSSQTGV